MTEQKLISIAIDGPAGSGKSTVSKMLAKKLGWKCLETGAIYRAITYSFLVSGGENFTEQQYLNWLDNLVVSVEFNGSKQSTLINGEDVTRFLRDEKVENKVATISAIEQIRAKVRKLQIKIASGNRAVIEGRDIGSVVIPGTVNKFYLKVSDEVSAQRRFNERKEQGLQADYNEILAEIRERNRKDSTRDNSPLIIPADAKVIETDNKNQEGVVNEIISKLSCVKFKEDEMAL